MFDSPVVYVERALPQVCLLGRFVSRVYIYSRDAIYARLVDARYRHATG